MARKTKRDAQVHILLTDHEKEALHRWAEADDRTVTANVRRLFAEHVPGFVPAKTVTAKTVKR